jgi:hypothetical protein
MPASCPNETLGCPEKIYPAVGRAALSFHIDG